MLLAFLREAQRGDKKYVCYYRQLQPQKKKEDYKMVSERVTRAQWKS